MTELKTCAFQLADADAKVVWYHKGERILDMPGLSEKLEVKALAKGVHQLIINDCLTIDEGEIRQNALFSSLQFLR